MAIETVIRFAAQNLERASSLAKTTAQTLKDMVRGVDDVKQRVGLKKAVQQEQKVERQELKAEGSRLQSLRRIGSQVTQAPADAFATGRQLLGTGRRLLGAASGNINAAGGLLNSAFAGAGIVAALTKIVADEMQATVDRTVASAVEKLEVRIEERTRESNFGRRLQEDVLFADEVARKALEAVVADEKAGNAAVRVEDGQVIHRDADFAWPE